MVTIENPHQYFYAHNGAVLRNLGELVHFLMYCDADTFSYHVNKEKNDFANWVRDILEEGALAVKLARAKTQKQMVKLVYAVVSKQKDKERVLSELKVAMTHG